MSEKEISRGNQAKLLLDNPLLKEAFEKLETLYKEEIFKTKLDDEKERNSIYLCFNTLTTVKAHLLEIMQTGELAEQSKKQPKVF
tara:strand:- start:163 stop:417 length:255 start_codon:yes stop_codon:yes gene_type:complete